MNRRAVGGRPLRKAFLIVCEGEKTEPLYFKGFKLGSVEVRGLGKNTKTLVEDAIRLKEAGDPYDQYWCVFDRDSFPANQFNGALQKAASAGFEVAYSNEAFEIWYLLHFDYIESALSRRQYPGKLEERLGRAYRKNDPDMFETLRGRLPQAIRNAEKLLARYPNHNPEKDNPCTTVHRLVEALNEELEKVRGSGVAAR